VPTIFYGWSINYNQHYHTEALKKFVLDISQQNPTGPFSFSLTSINLVLSKDVQSVHNNASNQIKFVLKHKIAH